MVRAAFRRLTHPAAGATYTPAELVVLLNQFDYTAAGVPIRRLTRALSLCLENKVRQGKPQNRVLIFGYLLLSFCVEVGGRTMTSVGRSWHPAKFQLILSLGAPWLVGQTRRGDEGIKLLRGMPLLV